MLCPYCPKKRCHVVKFGFFSRSVVGRKSYHNAILQDKKHHPRLRGAHQQPGGQFIHDTCNESQSCQKLLAAEKE